MVGLEPTASGLQIRFLSIAEYDPSILNLHLASVIGMNLSKPIQSNGQSMLLALFTTTAAQ